jgi:hypothetical protein
VVENGGNLSVNDVYIEEQDQDQDVVLNDKQIEKLLRSIGKTVKKHYKKNKSTTLNDEEIELKLTATMEGFNSRISSAKQDHFIIMAKEFDMQSVFTTVDKKFNLILKAISVQDCEQTSIYKNIVSLKDETDNLIDIKVCLINDISQDNLDQIATKKEIQSRREKLYFRNYLDANHFDLEINANVSKLKFTFLYKHTETIMVIILKLQSICLKKY